MNCDKVLPVGTKVTVTALEETDAARGVKLGDVATVVETHGKLKGMFCNEKGRKVAWAHNFKIEGLPETVCLGFHQVELVD